MRTPVILSCYWLACLAGLGTFFPLYSLYLSDNLGMSGWQIGLVLSVIPFVGLLAQPLWGAAADRTGSRARILTILNAGAALGYAGLHGRDSFAGVIAATAFLAVFSTSVMPMSVSVTLALLRERGPRSFGIVRSFGTLGYLIAVGCFPLLLHALYPSPTSAAAGAPAEPRLDVFLWVTATAMLASALISLLLPRKGAIALQARRGDWRRLRSNVPYLRLLAVMLATYAFLHGPLVMFPMFVRSLGGSVDVISRMWLFMIAFEIPLLVLMGAAPARIGARELIGIGIGADALRWLVCALSPSLPFLYAAQVLHGVAVAGVVIGCARYVEAVVPGRLASTAQGLVYMIGISLGGILSTLVVGALVDSFGPRAPAMWGGVGAMMLALALPWILPSVQGRDVEDSTVAQAGAAEASLPGI